MNQQYKIQENNKNRPKNFNLVELIMKELQETVIKIQLNDLERERERISKERSSENLFLEK